MYNKNQLLTTAVVNWLAMIVSSQVTWPTTLVELFSSQRTPLERPMTDTESALFGSLTNVGCIPGMLLYAYLYDAIGRKNTVTVGAIPLLITWTVLCVSKSIVAVLISVFISGLSYGAFMVSIIFLTEIASVDIRGALSSSSAIGFALGVLISYTIGGILEFKTVIYINMALVLIFIAFSRLTKESPTFLLMRNDEKGALESLAFYRDRRGRNKQLQEELEEIKRTIASESLTTTDEEQTHGGELLKKEVNAVAEKKKVSAWKLICFSKPVRRTFFLCTVLSVLSYLMGIFAVLVYADTLFRTAAPNLSPTVCSILLALSLLASAVFCVLVADSLGRKMLMIISCSMSGVFLLVLATQLHFNWGSSWISVIAILLYTFVFNCGAGIVPFVIGGEIFIPEVRGLGSAIALNIGFLINFSLLFVFPLLAKLINVHGVFYIFVMICFLSTFYCIKFMPETKGLTSAEIQKFFHK